MKIVSEKLIAMLETMIEAIDQFLPTDGLTDEEKQHILASYIYDRDLQSVFFKAVYFEQLEDEAKTRAWIREAIKPPPAEPEGETKTCPVCSGSGKSEVFEKPPEPGDNQKPLGCQFCGGRGEVPCQRKPTQA